MSAAAPPVGPQVKWQNTGWRLECLPGVVPGPPPLQAGSCYHPAGWLASADGAGGVHTEGDILSSEVIAGGVVLREPDDAHDSVDELDHQNGCKKR